MFGLLSALAMTAGLSASPSTGAPPPVSAAHEPRPAPPAPALGATTPGAELSQAIKSYLVSSGLVASSQLQVPPSPMASPTATPSAGGGGAAAVVPGVVTPGSAGDRPGASASPPATLSGPGAAAAAPFGPAPFGSAPFGPAPFGPATVAFGSRATPFVVGMPAGGGAPASGTGGRGWPTAAPAASAANEAISGAGGPGSTTPTSGGTGDCNITVTDLTIPLSVRCTTGDSGSVRGTGTGGDSGTVTGVVASDADSRGAGAANAAVSFFDSSAIATGPPGDGSSSAIEGTKGNCLLDTTNSYAALSVTCTPGAVGTAQASAAGATPGSTGVGGGSWDGASQGGSGPDVATSGDGGNATTTVTTGRTGNCIIHLVNIRAALTVVCISGSSGAADGAARGGKSGSATLLALASGPAASGDSNGVATSGNGGNAIAVISSGSTGSCIIFLVNVMASVTVLCITGDSGPASGTATGGASGSALVLAVSTGGDPMMGGPGRAASGSGGRSTAVVTSGGTGNCIISLTNVWGSISLLCRTGNSGTALGRATGGDSGSALVMLKAPSTAPGAVEVASPFDSFPAVPQWHGGPAASRDSSVGFPAAATVVAATAAGGPTRSPTQAISPASSLPVTGAETPVPLSLAAGLMLTGGVAVVATTRRRRRLRQH